MGESKYKIIKLLGSGSYGDVYLAKKKFSQNSSDYVAIKKFSIRDKKAYESFQNEIKIFKKIKSDYIVKILDYYKDSTYMYIVMEYAPNGDLEEYIRSSYKNKGFVDTKFIDTVIFQLTEGLNLLHKNNIIHRDIKASNILIFNNDLIKITDFGVSKILDEKNLLANTAIGTPYYMSPEIVNGKPYDFGVDFWALGCLIYKLLTNKYPFEAQSMPKLFYKIIKGKYSNYNIPEKYKNIISKLLKDNFNRANEKDLHAFILNNCNTFINRNRSKNNFVSPITEEKNNINKRLDPIYRKIEPINDKYKLKISEAKYNKYEPSKINFKSKIENIEKVYEQKISNIKKLDPINHPKIIPKEYINEPKRFNLLEPIDKNKYKYKVKGKKDFIRYNIQNIKELEKKRNRFRF